jgi:hypothetical protein
MEVIEKFVVVEDLKFVSVGIIVGLLFIAQLKLADHLED